MNSPFTTFLKPFLNYIDSGRFFREPMSWLYATFAIISLIVPVAIFMFAVSNNVLNMPGQFVTAFVLIWLVFAFVGWVNFQIWWNRRESVLKSSREGDEFTASMSFAHLIQTYGESIGVSLAITGTLSSLFAALILGQDASRFFRQMDMDFLGAGAAGGGLLAVLFWPIIGYMIILIFRFFAEIIRSRGAIANNTRALVMPERVITRPDPVEDTDIKNSLGF